jgi:AcrR family transcriptional regulator
MPDPRPRRTRERLLQALLSLARETPYDEIRMGDILARSGVARSTFYARYRDKEDLLITTFMEMLDIMSARGRAATPDAALPLAHPLLEHFAEARELGRSMQRAGKMDVLLRAIEARLVREFEARLKGGPEPQLGMTAAFAAGGFVALVRWWMAQGMRPEPAEVAAAYEVLAAPGLKAAQSRW